MCQCMKTGWKGWRGCPLQWREGFTDSKRMSKLECSNISVCFWMRTCCPAVSSVFFNPHKRAQQKLKNSHRLFLSSVLMKRAQDQAPTGDRHPLVCKSPSKLMLSYSIGKGLRHGRKNQTAQSWKNARDAVEVGWRGKCEHHCSFGISALPWQLAPGRQEDCWSGMENFQRRRGKATTSMCMEEAIWMIERASMSQAVYQEIRLRLKDRLYLLEGNIHCENCYASISYSISWKLGQDLKYQCWLSR